MGVTEEAEEQSKQDRKQDRNRKQDLRQDLKEIDVLWVRAEKVAGGAKRGK